MKKGKNKKKQEETTAEFTSYHGHAMLFAEIESPLLSTETLSFSLRHHAWKKKSVQRRDDEREERKRKYGVFVGRACTADQRARGCLQNGEGRPFDN